MIRLQLEMMFLVANLQTIVNAVIGDDVPVRSSRVKGTLEVMRYLMRQKLSIRSDFPWHYDLVFVREFHVSRVTSLKK